MIGTTATGENGAKSGGTVTTRAGNGGGTVITSVGKSGGTVITRVGMSGGNAGNLKECWSNSGSNGGGNAPLR